MVGRASRDYSHNPHERLSACVIGSTRRMLGVWRPGQGARAATAGPLPQGSHAPVRQPGRWQPCAGGINGYDGRRLFNAGNAENLRNLRRLGKGDIFRMYGKRGMYGLSVCRKGIRDTDSPVVRRGQSLPKRRVLACPASAHPCSRPGRPPWSGRVVLTVEQAIGSAGIRTRSRPQNRHD